MVNIQTLVEKNKELETNANKLALINKSHEMKMLKFERS